MADKFLSVDNQVHELKLGKSFDPKSGVYFHSMRYDFKPASVDTSQSSSVEIGEGNQVTVTVPHVEGSGTSHTVYKGNKKPCPKECVLIIDHKTGTFTLEKLTNNIPVKKTRKEGSSKANRPSTPVEVQKTKGSSPSKSKNQASPSSTKEKSPPNPSMPLFLPSTEKKDDASPIGNISDSSSSSGSDSSDSSDSSDNEMDTSQPGEVQATIKSQSVVPPPISPPAFKSELLSKDLQLSEDSSDSD